MITIRQNVVEEIKAEFADFGFPATRLCIARDYFNRMSLDEKTEIICMCSKGKGFAALSRASIAMVADIIDAQS